ncbi:Protein SDA1 like protein [Astathelohania contejeani]|uniref:Protein SDA1 n=1 Tax=Astathelohania contejeani TaxID=164912 RepID=A0ABQ7HVS5_9MICR|nr:Protein SDA1 like protein [Thelohania contejeani]
MDLQTLQINILRDPPTYEAEYRHHLATYESYIQLPTQPLKHLRPLLAFLSATSHLYINNYNDILLRHLSTASDSLIIEELLKHLFMLRRKKQINALTFFECIFRYNGGSKKMLRRLMVELEPCEGMEELLVGYVHNGTEAQARLAMFLCVVLYEKVGGSNLLSLICEHIPGTGKVSRIAQLYLLNELEITTESPRILSEIELKTSSDILKQILEKTRKKEERDIKYNRLRIASTILSTNNELSKYRNPICMGILRLINPSKEDLKDLMALLLETVSMEELETVIKKIGEVFCCEYKDDDFIAYGLNILREIYVKFLVGGNTPHVELIKELACAFKKTKVKGIFYAYNSLIKAMKGGCVIRSELDYVKKNRAGKINEKKNLKKEGVFIRDSNKRRNRHKKIIRKNKIKKK